MKRDAYRSKEWPRCYRTGKVAFSSELDADMVLAKRRRQDKGETRSYECPFCGHWHLTSKPFIMRHASADQ